MNNLSKRFWLFSICISVRLLFVYISKNIDITYLPYLGYLALLPASGFMYIYVTKSRQTGAEVFGEKIWWDSIRPLHSILYALFSYNAIYKNKQAWIFLLLDVLLGATMFTLYHFL